MPECQFKNDNICLITSLHVSVNMSDCQKLCSSHHTGSLCNVLFIFLVYRVDAVKTANVLIKLHCCIVECCDNEDSEQETIFHK